MKNMYLNLCMVGGGGGGGGQVACSVVTLLAQK